ncbi:Leucine-rich repeat serine/threonine-protein kinase 2, partial [Phytophthora pseudosyringae]
NFSARPGREPLALETRHRHALDELRDEPSATYSTYDGAKTVGERQVSEAAGHLRQREVGERHAGWHAVEHELLTWLIGYTTRKVLEQTRSLHRELDAVSEAVDDVPVANWEPQWLEDRRVLREGWEGLRQDRASLAAELLDAASQVEAMMLPRCETETYFAKYAPDELGLLNAVFGYAASLSRAEVPHVPR